MQNLKVVIDSLSLVLLFLFYLISFLSILLLRNFKSRINAEMKHEIC